MKFVVQRVLNARVAVAGQTVGAIQKGYLVLAGIQDADTEEIADKMIKKLLNLRIFADTEGKTNLSLMDVAGELLIVSQFTLYADCKKGNRPSFIGAGKPEQAQALYTYIIEQCRKEGVHTKGGEFGAHMEVSLINDGPFTVVLDSEEIIRRI